MKLFMLVVSAALLVACSSKKPDKKPIIYPGNSPEVSNTDPKETSITAQQVASEQGSNLVTEVKFARGMTELSKGQINRINSLYNEAKTKGEIEEVQLITWADRVFPDQDKSNLAQFQQKLVDERNESLEKVLENISPDLEIKKISMAERATALEKFTASQNAQVQESLSGKKTAAKPSEAMVIFILKN